MPDTIIWLNRQPYELMRRFVDAYLREFERLRLKVVELGPKTREDGPSYRPLFASADWRYRALDVGGGDHAGAITANPGRWTPLPDASVDAVVAEHVLEQSEFPWETMREVSRILRPGGLGCFVIASAVANGEEGKERWQLDARGFRALAKYASLSVVEVFSARGLGVSQDTFGVVQKPAWSADGAWPVLPEALDRRVGRDFYLECFARRPQNACYYLEVARLMLDEGKLVKAIAALRCGLETVPEHPAIRERLQHLEDRAARKNPDLDGAIAALGRRPIAIEAVGQAARFFERAEAFERRQLAKSQEADPAALRQIAGMAGLHRHYGLAAQCWEALAAAQRLGLDDLLSWACDAFDAGAIGAAKALFRRARDFQLEQGIPNRATVAQRLIWKLRARTYLEIGVGRGTHFMQIEAPRKIALDPTWRIPSAAQDVVGISAVRSNPEDFFAALPRDLAGDGVGLVLINECRTAEQALAYVENSLRLLIDGGVILLHNCLPKSEEDARGRLGPVRRQESSETCAGDVYRAIVRLRAERRDLFACVVEAENGIGIVTRGEPEGRVDLDRQAIDALAYSGLRAGAQWLLNLKSAQWFDGWLVKVGGNVDWYANPRTSASTAAFEPSSIVEPGPCADSVRSSSAGRSAASRKERVVFINSIGGLGDSIPIPLAIQWYKSRHPDHTTIFYDSLYVHHFFEPFEWVDEVYVAGEHLHSDGLPAWLRTIEPAPPCVGGVPLERTRFTRLASTHHAHERKFAPDELVVKMDHVMVLTEIVRGGFRSFDLRLKPEHMERVDRIVRGLAADGRALFGIQTRGACPYDGLMVPRADYVRDLTAIADRLVGRYAARVLVCGDDRLLSEERYARGDWIDLDALVRNVYYKFEIMKRTRVFLGATSGFSDVVNLVRSPEQVPAIPIYASVQSMRGGALTSMYPNYERDGGGAYDGDIRTFRDPVLKRFVFDDPHTPEKVLAIVERFLRQTPVS
jgi:SAM-dependent methyltransferase